MDFRTRAEIRRGKIIANRAKSYREAEEWDLEFWQSHTPQERLSALVDIREDIAKINPERLEE